MEKKGRKAKWLSRNWFFTALEAVKFKVKGLTDGVPRESLLLGSETLSLCCNLTEWKGQESSLL